MAYINGRRVLGIINTSGGGASGGGHKLLKTFDDAIQEVSGETGLYYIDASDLPNYVITDTATGTIPTEYNLGDVVIAISQDIQGTEPNITITEYIEAIYIVNGINDSTGDLILEKQMKSKGKQLYQHNIYIKGNISAGQFLVSLTIINQDNTPFTQSSLYDYFDNNGFNSTTKIYNASGSAGNNLSSVIGMAAINNYLQVAYYNGSITYVSSIASFDDTIIPL